MSCEFTESIFFSYELDNKAENVTSERTKQAV